MLLAVEDVVFFGQLRQRLGEQLFDVAGVVAVAKVEVEKDAGDGVLVRPVHEGAGYEVGVGQDDAFVVEGGDGQRAHADALDRAFVVADGDDVAVAQGALDEQQDAADEVVGNRLHAEADPDTERTGEDGEGGEVNADDAQREEEAEGNGGVLAEDGEAVTDAQIGDGVVDPAVAEGFYPAADAVDDVKQYAHQQDVEQGEVAVVAFGDGGFEQGQRFLDDRGVLVPAVGALQQAEDEEQAAVGEEGVHGVDDVLRPEDTASGAQRVAFGAARAVLEDGGDGDPDERVEDEDEQVLGDNPGEVEVAERANQAEGEDARRDGADERAQDAVGGVFLVEAVHVGEAAAGGAPDGDADEQVVEGENPAVGVGDEVVVQYPVGHEDEREEQAADRGVDDGRADDAAFFRGGDEVGGDEVARGVVGDGVKKQHRGQEHQHVRGGGGDAAGVDEDKRELEQRQIGQVVLQHLAEEKQQASGEGKLFLAGVAADGAVQDADDAEGGKRQQQRGEGEQQPLLHSKRLQAAVEGLQSDGVLADEHAAGFQDGGGALRQGGEVAAEAVLLGELVLCQLRVAAVGDVAVHLQTHHVVVQQDF